MDNIKDDGFLFFFICPLRFRQIARFPDKKYIPATTLQLHPFCVISKEIFRVIQSLFIFYFFILLTACQHKELCYDHHHTEKVCVVFDWRNAPDADPGKMWVYLYPDDGGEVQLYEFSGRNGDTLDLPYGSYRGICLNSDSHVQTYRGTEKYETCEVYAVDGRLGVRSASAPRAEGAESQILVQSPDRLWTDRQENIHVVRGNGLHTITFYPSWKLQKIHLLIDSVDNLETVLAGGICGSISGMAGGRLPGMDKLSPEQVTIPFSVARTGGNRSSLEADFFVYGHCQDRQNPHHIMLYVTQSDGSRYYYDYDVTDQLHKGDWKNEAVIYIHLDRLKIPGILPPAPGGEDGGFQPDMDQWESVDVPLQM